MIQKSVFFDLDGTFLDTSAAFLDTIAYLAQHYAQPLVSALSIRHSISHGIEYVLENAFSPAFRRATPSLKKEFLDYYMAHLARKTQPFPGMIECMEWFNRCSIPWGIVTNRITAHTLPLLEQLHLLDHIPVLVCGDTLSVCKPHPEPLFYACQKLGVQPEYGLYIGDAERDIQAGSAAGMQTIVALYGYIGADDHPEHWGGDRLAQSAAECIAYIQEHVQATCL